MKTSRVNWRILFAGILWLLSGNVMGQFNSNYSIASVSGKYSYTQTQVPDNLAITIAPVNGTFPADITYQWESSPTPFGTYTSLPAGNQPTYVFTAALTQTTYVRQTVTINSGANVVHSNIIKIQIGSSHWEDVNYTREHDIMVSGMADATSIDQLPIGQKLQSTTYADGLSRTIQKVVRETAAPDVSQPNGPWGDVVQFSSYDGLGREQQQYLGYSTITESGNYKSSPGTEQQQYYLNNYNETSAFTTTQFDQSPLNRVVNAKSSGASWALGLGKSVSYDLNDGNDDNVQMWQIGFNSGDVPYSMGAYPANSLFKTVHTDENGKMVVVYANLIGQTILTKVQLDDDYTTAHKGWICTYSVYDDFGRLRYQIQPEAVKWLDGHLWSFSGAEGQQVLDGLCFRYEYDEKGRPVLKKVPGAKELYMLYDARDRLVFTQDGDQRNKTTGEWIANIYDDLDRPVITGLYTSNETQAALQTDINNALSYNTVAVTIPDPAYELNIDEYLPRDITSPADYIASYSITFDDGFSSFLNDNFDAYIADRVPTGASSTIITLGNPISYQAINDPSKFTALKYLNYDDYSYDGAKAFDNGYNNTQAYSASDPGVEPISASVRLRGMITGTRTRVLGTATFLSSSFYYDEKGRAIQTISDNLKSGTDVTTVQYHFNGRVLSVDRRHTAAATVYSNFDILTKYNYDKIGRQSSIQKKFGSNAFKTVVSYEYDDFGRIKRKHLDPEYTGGKPELESQTFSYNIHGELTGVNKDYALKTPGKYDKWGNFFGFYLGYDKADGGFTRVRLDGNITGTVWSTQGDDAQRKYDYTYDNSGRLTSASFAEKPTISDGWGNSTMDFSVSGRNGKIEYDLNGNLLYMSQKGIVPGNQTPVQVDDLEYSYQPNSNQLKRVYDAAGSGTGTLDALNGRLGDFSDGSNGSGDDYVYDANGNLVVDLNKNLQSLPGASSNYGVSYNFLDKPEMLHLVGKGTIQIVYDADGKKLQRTYTPEGGGTPVTTTYINEYVYQGNDLQYIDFEEGRVRVLKPLSSPPGYDLLTIDGNIDLPDNMRGAWDFFVRDHLGNVRMVLTEETHIGSNTCTMELDRVNNEEPLFGQVDAAGVPTASNEVKARFPVSSIPGQLSNNGWNDNTIGSYVSQLGGLVGKKMGPNALVKVMAGDQISAKAIYYYTQPSGNISNSSLLSDLLASLAGALTGNPSANSLIHSASGSIKSNLASTLTGNSFVDPGASAQQMPGTTPPNAYLYVLFFDERMNFVPENSVSYQVSQPGNGAQPLLAYQKTAPKNGYAFVYLCNASDQTVYFDNLQVTNNHGPIVEENHYYPYGLRIAGISSRKMPDPNEGHVDNKYGYNDKELFDDGNLNWYDYGFRNYDSQIGRFVQLDPLSSKFPYLTPYQYASDEPVKNIDIDGLEAAPGELPLVTVVHGQAVEGLAPEIFGRALQLITSVTLANFGNNAIIHSYISNTGRILWGDKNLGDRITYRGEEWTYIGSAQISAGPTMEEVLAAARETALRNMIPEYGRMMGFLEGGHDLLLDIAYIFNTKASENTLVNMGKGIWWYFSTPDFEKNIAFSAALSKVDLTDATTQGQIAFVALSTVAVPGALEADAARATVAGEKVLGAAEIASDAAELDGSFSILNWEGYPAELPKPEGPFRLLNGGEYKDARQAANAINDAIRETNNMRGVPYEIHELQPVKFGGSPTDPLNKIGIPKDLHSNVTQWWNALQRDLEPYTLK